MVIDKYAPLVKTKFTRQPALSVKDIKINNLQHKRDHWRHEAHKNSTDEKWKIKISFTETKVSFTEKIFTVIHRILNPNMNRLQADPSALNQFFNKTAERLVRENATNDDVILSYIDSRTNNPNRFKL